MLGYSVDEPARVEVDALPGAAVVQFGSNTCGYCRAAQPLIEEAFAAHPGMRRIKIEDALRTGANYHHWSVRQLRQISGNVIRVSAMNTTDSTGKQVGDPRDF